MAENQKPQTANLKPGQLIVTIPPTIQPFLTEVVNRETNRTGKKVTPDQMLIELFWLQIKNGPGDHLPITFSRSEINTILANVKANNPQPPTPKP